MIFTVNGLSAAISATSGHLKNPLPTQIGKERSCGVKHVINQLLKRHLHLYNRTMPAPTLFHQPERQTFTPRDYQQDAVEAAIAFFNEPKNKMGNGICVLPTGSGKSLIIALIIKGLVGKTIVLQPSKEILEQNFEKLQSYGYTAGIYSASLNKKEVRKITFATIGSVVNNAHLFEEFQHLIIDECHTVNSKGDGMYKRFIESLEGIKVLGLTATPYRLSSTSAGSMLKFLTRTSPKIFKRVIYYINTRPLFAAGHLAALKYFDMAGFDRKHLEMKANGSGYTDESVKREFNKSNLEGRLLKIILRLVEKEHKHILVFTQFVDEAIKLTKIVDRCGYVEGTTSKTDREAKLKAFKEGKIQVMANVGVLTTGFDFPALSVCVIARPTMSLALYYQMVGRIMRPHASKEFGMVIDLCGNIQQFGAIEDLVMEFDADGKWVITSRGRRLTNVTFGEGKPAYLDK